MCQVDWFPTFGQVFSILSFQSLSVHFGISHHSAMHIAIVPSIHVEILSGLCHGFCSLFIVSEMKLISVS